MGSMRGIVATVVAWALVGFGAVAYAWTIVQRLREPPEHSREGRGRRIATRLGTIVGAVTASFGGLTLAMVTAVEDFSDDDSATEEASTREGLLIFGLVLVAAGLWVVWATTRHERSQHRDRRTSGGPSDESLSSRSAEPDSW